MKPKYKQMSKRVLLLNASEEVVNIIEWNRAVKLLYSGKALEHTVDEFYEIRLPDKVIQLPKSLFFGTTFVFHIEELHPLAKIFSCVISIVVSTVMKNSQKTQQQLIMSPQEVRVVVLHGKTWLLVAADVI
jgi:hypothetical protein